VEGWRPVEDIVRWGFGQAPAVMVTVNELTGTLPARTGPPVTLLAEDGA
jgi:hypothetical protein